MHTNVKLQCYKLSLIVYIILDLSSKSFYTHSTTSNSERLLKRKREWENSKGKCFATFVCVLFPCFLFSAFPISFFYPHYEHIRSFPNSHQSCKNFPFEQMCFLKCVFWCRLKSLCLLANLKLLTFLKEENFVQSFTLWNFKWIVESLTHDLSIHRNL